MELTTVKIGHINNLYNTTFWTLIQKGGMDGSAAEQALAVRSAFFLLSSQNLQVYLLASPGSNAMKYPLLVGSLAS